MVIDVHTHIAFDKLYAAPYLEDMTNNLVGALGRQPAGAGAAGRNAVSALVQGFLKDKDCTQLIRQMDTAGIAKAVLLVLDGGIAFGEAEYGIEAIFEHYHGVLRAHPDRFIVFGGVDPRRGDAGLELFKKGVRQYGFKGLKLYPPMGYAMDDARLNAYYEICAEAGLPVLIHTGPSLPALQNELADPGNAYEVARRFSGVNFILAHAGYRLHQPAVQRVLTLPNVYLDIAGFQAQYRQVDEQMVAALGPIFQPQFNTRVLFGTDWPLFNLMNPLVRQVNLIRDLWTAVAPAGGTAALENILYRNAAGILPG